MTELITIHNALASWPRWTDKEPLLSAELGNGRSNKSYLLSEDETPRFVLRINEEFAQQPGISRSQELAILKSTSDQALSPELVYSDPNCQFIVYRYVQGLTLAELPKNKQLALSSLANLLQDIHATKLPFNVSNLALTDYCRLYWQSLQNIQSRDVDGRNIDDVVQSIRATHTRMARIFDNLERSLSYVKPNCLCHNDLIPDNIIQGTANNQLLAIDWEYASFGNSYFDLACVCETHGLNNTEIEELLALYHQPDNKSSIDYQYSLKPYRLVYRYIELLWLAYQYGIAMRAEVETAPNAAASLATELNRKHNILSERLENS